MSEETLTEEPLTEEIPSAEPTGEDNHSTCPICGIYSDGGSHHQPFCQPIRDLQARVTALEEATPPAEDTTHHGRKSKRMEE